MTERDMNPRSGLRVVEAIGREFERVLDEDRSSSWVRGRSLRRGRTMSALALAFGLVAVGAAGATTGLFSVGSVIRAGQPQERPEYRQNVDETILAVGSTPVAGPWRITAYKSQRLVEDGKVLQPAGLLCLRFVLTSPPPERPGISGRYFCGERGKDGFNAASLQVTGRSGGSEIIAFGQAPESASGVELTAEGGQRIRAQLHEGPADIPGDIWVLTSPSRLEDPSLELIRKDGRAQGPKLDVSKEFESPPAGP